MGRFRANFLSILLVFSQNTFSGELSPQNYYCKPLWAGDQSMLEQFLQARKFSMTPQEKGALEGFFQVFQKSAGAPHQFSTGAGSCSTHKSPNGICQQEVKCAVIPDQRFAELRDPAARAQYASQQASLQWLPSVVTCPALAPTGAGAQCPAPDSCNSDIETNGTTASNQQVNMLSPAFHDDAQPDTGNLRGIGTPESNGLPKDFFGSGASAQ